MIRGMIEDEYDEMVNIFSLLDQSRGWGIFHDRPMLCKYPAGKPIRLFQRLGLARRNVLVIPV